MLCRYEFQLSIVYKTIGQVKKGRTFQILSRVERSRIPQNGQVQNQAEMFEHFP